MTDERKLSEFHMSRKSPATEARDFMSAFNDTYPGLFEAAEQAFSDATRRRQFIFWAGSGVIVIALAGLWWSNSQGITNISPWLIVAGYAAFWGINKWQKAASKRAFRERFERAGVSEEEYRNLSYAVALVGYSGVMMIAFNEMAAFAEPPADAGAGDLGAGDFGGGFGGGDIGGM